MWLITFGCADTATRLLSLVLGREIDDQHHPVDDQQDGQRRPQDDEQKAQHRGRGPHAVIDVFPDGCHVYYPFPYVAPRLGRGGVNA